MDFGAALTWLKSGKKVCRSGWNGRGMYLILIKPNEWDSTQTKFKKLPWIGMKTVDDSFVPWLASQTDLLAMDWEVIND